MIVYENDEYSITTTVWDSKLKKRIRKRFTGSVSIDIDRGHPTLRNLLVRSLMNSSHKSVEGGGLVTARATNVKVETLEVLD